MDEQQSDDLYIPAFLLKLPLKPDANGRNEDDDDFLRTSESWFVNFPIDASSD